VARKALSRREGDKRWASSRLGVPKLAARVSTGIEIDPQSFASLPDKLTLSTCPFCGLDHVWLKCDARFVEEQIPELPGDGVSVAAKEMTGP